MWKVPGKWEEPPIFIGPSQDAFNRKQWERKLGGKQKVTKLYILSLCTPQLSEEQNQLPFVRWQRASGKDN